MTNNIIIPSISDAKITVDATLNNASGEPIGSATFKGGTEMLPILFPQPISSWTPASLGAALIGWWDGQDPAATGTPPVDGTAISTWVDKQGINNLTQNVGGNKPIYKTSSGINGFPSIDFSSLNKVVQSSAIPGLVGNKDVTLFIVANIVNDNECAAALGTVTATGQEIGFIRRQSGDFRGFVYGGRLTDSISSDSNPHVFITTYNSATSELTTWVDGVLSISSASFTASNTDGIVSIGEIPAIASMNGYVGEAGLMNTVCTVQQMSALTAYLKNRWGIS